MNETPKTYEDLPKFFPDLFYNERFAFECGQGWFNLIGSLCRCIYWHVESVKDQVKFANRHNELYDELSSGVHSKFDERYPKFDDRGHIRWDEQSREWHLKRTLDIGRLDVPDIPKVKIVQVKEKFGTLRFYVDGADAEINGMIRMAENVSCYTCEVCGNPGKRTSAGWIQTLCETHKVLK